MSKFTEYMVFLKGLRVVALREETYKLAGWVKSAQGKLEDKDRIIAELKDELAKLKSEGVSEIDWGNSAFEDFVSEPVKKEKPISAKDWLVKNNMGQHAHSGTFIRIAKQINPVGEICIKRGFKVKLYNPSELLRVVSAMLK